ncbi:MAG: cytochrome c3 family protein [Bacteroidia bacterium]
MRQSRVLKNHLLSLLIMLFAGVSLQAQGDPVAGEALYNANCSACHKPDRKLVGPQLQGVADKYADDKEWLYKWVKNSPKLIKDGDPKAVALWNEYGQAAMQAFPTLSDSDIENILAYADAYVPEIKDPINVSQNGDGSSSPLNDPAFYYSLLALVGVLVLIALLLVLITATLVAAVRAKENGEDFEMSNVWSLFKSFITNKFVMTLIIAVLGIGATVQFVEWARGMSIHQGYMPEQPIKFSHQLHAGEYEIACEYCHTGVRKSKNAWIPSVNVCMNCHKYIEEGPKYGKEEIAKIRSAYESGEAIEWVRIHNLPDHAYFNHAQHVVVGGLECEQCHGDVKKMEVVYQYSTLGMGWCINCHRQEQVKVAGAPNPDGLTVEDMGGLNCARCHY